MIDRIDKIDRRDKIYRIDRIVKIDRIDRIERTYTHIQINGYVKKFIST